MARFIEVVCIELDEEKLHSEILQKAHSQSPVLKEDDLTDEQYRIINGEDRNPQDKLIEVKIDNLPMMLIVTSINVDHIDYFEPDGDKTTVIIGKQKLTVDENYEVFSYLVQEPRTFLQKVVDKIKFWIYGEEG